MTKTEHITKRLNAALEALQECSNQIKRDKLHAVAPRDAEGFVDWYISSQQELGTQELAPYMLAKAAEAYGVELGKSAGWWIRACGFEENRTISQRVYSISKQKLLENQLAAQDTDLKLQPAQKETPQDDTDLKALLNNWGK